MMDQTRPIVWGKRKSNKKQQVWNIFNRSDLLRLRSYHSGPIKILQASEKQLSKSRWVAYMT